MSRKNANREVFTELVVGAFVALVFLGLAVFTIVISGKNLFNDEVFGIEVVLPDAMGLRPNDPVIARGTTVGSVKDVRFQPDGVHVKAQLEAPVQFHEGYEITVVSTSILGGRQLVLKEGDPDAPAVSDVNALVGQKPSDLMEDATAAIARVREFLDTDVLTNLVEFSESLKEIGRRLEDGEGTIGRLLAEDSVYTNLDASVANIRLISDRLERGEGTVGKLLSSDDEIYTNLNAAVADARAAIADLKTIASRLEAGEGTIGRLLVEDSVYTNLDVAVADARSAIADLKSITARLERGEGTVGKLLSSDDELYQNVNGTVTDARALLDDMREANTLSTFTSLLFSGF